MPRLCQALSLVELPGNQRRVNRQPAGPRGADVLVPSRRDRSKAGKCCTPTRPSPRAWAGPHPTGPSYCHQGQPCPPWRLRASPPPQQLNTAHPGATSKTTRVLCTVNDSYENTMGNSTQNPFQAKANLPKPFLRSHLINSPTGGQTQLNLQKKN